jgi:hypothetical protein
VSSERPLGFQQTGPEGCYPVSAKAPAKPELEAVYLRLEAEAGAAPGPRKLTLQLQRGAGQAAQRQFPVHVARSGTATLAEAAYLRANLRKALGLGRFASDLELAGALERLSSAGAHSLEFLDRTAKEPISIPALRDGTPIRGQNEPVALEAPLVELLFTGRGVGSLKFAAPRCLGASVQEALDSDRLRVRAQFRLPGGTSAARSGVVSRRADLPSAPCQWFLYDPILDPVIGRRPLHNGKDPSNFTFLEPRDFTVRIEPASLTIAAMGDSYAAGEGAPDRFDRSSQRATWELEQCHRSANSGLTRAARKIAEIPGVWVLYSSFACSGATIHLGIIGPYVGVPRPFGSSQPAPLLSQIDQAKAWLSEQGQPRLDALLLGIGGNDVAFAQVVGDCISSAVGDCSSHAPLLQSVLLGEQASTAVIGFDSLPGAYDVLAEQLAEIKPGKVFITEYPDPTRIGGPLEPSDAQLEALLCNAVEVFDDHFAVAPQHLFWGDVTPEHPLAKYLEIGGKTANLEHREIKWILKTLVQPLNRAVAAAADKHGWRFVSGFVEHAYDHGFCLAERYILTLQDSVNTQGDVFGSVHPNKEAYELYGDLLAWELGLYFDLPDRPEIRVVEERHSQEISRHVLGDTDDETNLVRGITPEETRFRIQIAPTTRDLNVTFEFRQRSAAAGGVFSAWGSMSGARDGQFQSRLEYTARRTLNHCETLEYRWKIEHSRDDGMKTLTTPARSLTTREGC